MPKRPKTTNINLRLPTSLHKKLVEAAAITSPPKSLNSEILSRLFESFGAEVKLEQIQSQVREFETHAVKRLDEVEESVEARLREIENRAAVAKQRMESALKEALRLQDLAKAKLGKGTPKR